MCQKASLMPSNTKLHIGIFGRRNSGKSSLINFIIGQEVAIVSDHAGTTTDPVKKNIEIYGLGPCVLIDTAGIDDVGELGEQRVEKSLKVLKEIDCAILVITDNLFAQPEIDLARQMKELSIPFFVVHNKSDLNPLDENLQRRIEQGLCTAVIDLSATAVSNRETALQQFTEALKKTIPTSAYQKIPMLGDVVRKGDIVVLVCPIDAEAPEGRLILPQVMAIRDALDNECICVVVKETQLEQYFREMPRPALVVTDSQVFGYVNKIVPPDVPLTSFSIVMARMRGDFDSFVKGTPHLSALHDGDRILLLESCTHHSTCEDIGRVKLPRMISQFTGKNLEFDFVAGLAPIGAIGRYAMAIQCGGCMATRRQLLNRISAVTQAGVPVSNYGMAMAYMTGIFDRVIEIFKL